MTRNADGSWDKSTPAQPSRDRGAGARAAPILLLCHGPRDAGDRPAVRRRRVVLERGRAVQHRADASGARRAAEGVKAAGATPREFCTITVTDGIAMGHEGMRSSLVSREVIADSVELTIRGHGYDALVGVAGCDKSLPGMMMAMLRLNVPSVFLYGGSILPGRFQGRDVTVVDVFEGVGQHSAGKMSDEDLRRAGTRRVPRRRRLRRAIHRQHHGLRVRSDRVGPAALGRAAGSLSGA